MKQIVQPDTQQSTDIQSAVGLYLFIYPLLIPNSLIKIIVLPYLKNQQSQTITNNRDTDPSTRGMANPSGLNRLRARVFKGKAISDCNSPAIANTYQHSDWKLWPQSDNPRRVRDALQYDNRDRLKKRGKLDYSYDDNGSLISITHADNGLQRSFIYYLDNRLIQVKDGQGQSLSSYQYDPFGRRISKTVGTVTTYYFYSAEGLVAEMSASGQVTTQYGYRPDGTWGTNPLYIKQKGYTGYYQNDHLGTPQQIVSSSGQVLWSANYSAFGLAVVTTNVVTNNLRLAGQYYDQETNLHYNYFRYYDPTVGRYVTSDPIGLRGGINTYGYVEGNPLSFVDPDGLRPFRSGGNPNPRASFGNQRGIPRLGAPRNPNRSELRPNTPFKFLPRNWQNGRNRLNNYIKSLPGNNPFRDNTGPNEHYRFGLENPFLFPLPKDRNGQCYAN